MQRSIRRAAEIQLQRTNLLSHLSNSNAVHSFVRSAYRTTENSSRVILRTRGYIIAILLPAWRRRKDDIYRMSKKKTECHFNDKFIT